MIGYLCAFFGAIQVAVIIDALWPDVPIEARVVIAGLTGAMVGTVIGGLR